MTGIVRRRQILLLSASFLVSPLFAAQSPQDSQILLQIVRETRCDDVSSDASNQAAAVLARSGHSKELLEILAATSGYCVMGTIAQTLREATLPVFEKRIHAEPGNRYLLGALSNIQSPSAGPLLEKTLAARSDIESIGPILHALVANQVATAGPLVKRRFENTPREGELLKTEYGLGLLGLGDASAVPWLKSKIESKTDSADRIADGLAWLAGSQPPFALLVDESSLTPLLPGLGECVATRTFGDVCARTLEVLTRQNHPARGDTWKKWITANKNRHPIYSKPLDNAVRASLLKFRANLESSGRRDPAMDDAVGYLKQPIRGGNFLWRFDVNPALSAGWDPKQGLGFDLLCGVALSSAVRVPQNLVFRKDLIGLNLTLMVATSKTEQIGALTEAASEAVKHLEAYANGER
ncbi:MAG: hypothetical protein AUJ52_04350 [Elusimicrobia bacterium CG1_02_63_36]|nr:MAG: hypothetical protein AUJ52_04350 [Elusimicrobia bacterium CG1_02_63_36]PIP82275.1 MAG: hypothetical protein COR54_15785 [Elusimicrobia bacterium CG22_combo_CG10-13_8_21_14_all_63_91]PJA15308.1 MAG: hypothetical protein COX66_10305 [Elusimicrobia bacterium CG_4_10_14_0_2_um_filter_63_34]PJB27008.1 MAG: hypothetical protein CO113_00895 [Elusimicrobia bacterium CG_4_9_14_3_um_filter_62_55]